MSRAPSVCAVALAFAAPTSSITVLVARLLDRVIIRSMSSRMVISPPTRVYTRLSESEPASSE
jgi:hypothetical protein